jgi:hypothetical protein
VLNYSHGERRSHRSAEEGDAWNAWCEENPGIGPDLTGTKLSGTDLSGVDLEKALLNNANLGGALTEAIPHLGGPSWGEPVQRDPQQGENRVRMAVGQIAIEQW